MKPDAHPRLLLDSVPLRNSRHAGRPRKDSAGARPSLALNAVPKQAIAAMAQCASFNADSSIARRPFRLLRTTYSSYAVPSRSNFAVVSIQSTADRRRFDTVANGHCWISANICNSGYF